MRAVILPPFAPAIQPYLAAPCGFWRGQRGATLSDLWAKGGWESASVDTRKPLC
jgi:hypothetical protein